MQNRFIRSSYWGRWSLILTERFIGERQRILGKLTGRTPSPSIIEIDLEPINGWGRVADQINDVRRINIRRHCTARDGRDVLADTLPMAIENALIEHLGKDLAAWLLNPQTEILGLIDWQRYEKLCNGGASLLDCAHPHLAHLIPTNGPTDAFGRATDALATRKIAA